MLIPWYKIPLLSLEITTLLNLLKRSKEILFLYWNILSIVQRSFMATNWIWNIQTSSQQTLSPHKVVGRWQHWNTVENMELFHVVKCGKQQQALFFIFENVTHIKVHHYKKVNRVIIWFRNINCPQSPFSLRLRKSLDDPFQTGGVSIRIWFSS